MTTPLIVALVGAFAFGVGTLVGLALGRARSARPVGPTMAAEVDRSIQREVRGTAAVLQRDLRHVVDLVGALRQERAEQDGRLSVGLRHTYEATARLASTADSLQAALASPATRGQWGERMADDVLRMAGFVEGINYDAQRRNGAGTIPDYTFHLPKGRAVNMDVKFPLDNYLRHLEAATAGERERHVRAFRRDVRERVKELADRSYVEAGRTVDYQLLFIPNESVYGFVHEHDPELIDLALGRRVVLCSPTSLFAVLAVMREAVDNFSVERRSDEILESVAGIRAQWERFGDASARVARGLASAQKALDELTGPRRRQFERELDRLETVRDTRADGGLRVVENSPPVAQAPR